MRIVVLTGMSGSGKTNALRALEDIGFYAIDNLPIPLIDRLVELFSSGRGEVERLALVVDARTAHQGKASPGQTGDLDVVPGTLELTREAGHDVHLVFLDADDDVLVRRFSETRRRHPLGTDGSVRGGIEAERKLLGPLRAAATTTLDTSRMSVHDLRRTIQQAFFQPGALTAPQLGLNVMSFGFKHGVPPEADLVFDVRFLPNPYFVQELEPKTGEDAEVQRYVVERDETREFLGRLRALLEFLIPQYEREGKAYLTIAFGCTGGRHRSVALALDTASWIESLGRSAQVRHRDVRR